MYISKIFRNTKTTTEILRLTTQKPWLKQPLKTRLKCINMTLNLNQVKMKMTLHLWHVTLVTSWVPYMVSSHACECYDCVRQMSKCELFTASTSMIWYQRLYMRSRAAVLFCCDVSLGRGSSPLCDLKRLCGEILARLREAPVKNTCRAFHLAGRCHRYLPSVNRCWHECHRFMPVGNKWV